MTLNQARSASIKARCLTDVRTGNGEVKDGGATSPWSPATGMPPTSGVNAAQLLGRVAESLANVAGTVAESSLEVSFYFDRPMGFMIDTAVARRVVLRGVIKFCVPLSPRLQSM